MIFPLNRLSEMTHKDIAWTGFQVLISCIFIYLVGILIGRAKSVFSRKSRSEIRDKIPPQLNREAWIETLGKKSNASKSHIVSQPQEPPLTSQSQELKVTPPPVIEKQEANDPAMLQSEKISQERKVREKQQRHFEEQSRIQSEKERQRAYEAAVEKYLELERARKERFLHGDKLLLPGEDLDGNIHGTVIEARKLKEQQDAEFEEALKKDKEKEELARQKEEEMMTSYEKKEKRKEELKKRIASLKKTLLPEPPIGAEGRILIAIDLERNGRFKRFWLKTNKFKDLFHWVECLDVVREDIRDFNLETVFPRNTLSLNRHGERTLEELGILEQCVLRLQYKDS